MIKWQKCYEMKHFHLKLPFLYTIFFLSIMWFMSEMTSSSAISGKKVLLVSMDGFRYDYLTKANTPNFDKMIQEGVTMPYMNPVYPTSTAPNHHSMITGLYPESHGITENIMYDPVFDAYFSFSSREERWYEGEPLWATAGRAGLKTGSVDWPGDNAPHKGFHAIKLDDSAPSFELEMDVAVKGLSQDDLFLVLVHFDEPDISGHLLGPDHPEMVNVIERMDGLLGYILDKLNKTGLLSDVNLIVTSDHGMATIKQRVVVEDHTSEHHLRFYSPGAASSLLPQPGMIDAVKEDLNGLEHIKVMYKEDIPEEKHLKNHRRVMPLFAQSEMGWRIIYPFGQTSAFLGGHGYDNDEMLMKPIFVAMGPNFKSNETVEPIETVDIYPLICTILGIEPAPNNGSMSRAAQLLKST